MGCTINASLSASSYNYYVFVVDNATMISASTAGIFYINHYPSTPSVYSPSSQVTVNYVTVNYTSTDSDSDVINYIVYNSTDGTNYDMLVSSSSEYSWTGLSDALYYIKAYTIDQHGYSNYQNSSAFQFRVDTTAPTLNSVYTSTTSPYTTDSVSFYVNATDLGAGISVGNCKFTLHKSDYNSGLDFNLTSNVNSGDLFSISQTMAAYGSGLLYFDDTYCLDDFGNSAANNSVDIVLTISVPSSSKQPVS